VKIVGKQAQQAQSRKIQGTFRGPNKDQNASFKKRQDRLGQSPPRAARGGWLTVVCGRVHGRAPGSAAQFSVFFVSFRFPAFFSAFNSHYVFKMGMYLALEESRIHRIGSQTLSKTPLKKIEEEEEG